MKWMEKNETVLVKQSFLFGLSGMLLSITHLVDSVMNWIGFPQLYLLNGIGIALQFFGLSIAVLVLRKRKIQHETKEKAKSMILVLGVSLIFFFIVS